MGGKPRSKKITIGEYRFDRSQLCGKSIAHWENAAKEHVVETLLRASFAMDDRTIAGTLAKDRLINMAAEVDEALVLKVIRQRGRCLEGFDQIMKDIMGPPE